MTDDPSRAGREALDELASIVDGQNIEHYRAGTPLATALDRWLVDRHSPGCAHVRLGGMMLGRLNNDLLMCPPCAGRWWINDDYLSKVSMCDSCDRQMELPGTVNITSLGPFLIVGVLCLDCQPTIEGKASEEED